MRKYRYAQRRHGRPARPGGAREGAALASTHKAAPKPVLTIGKVGGAAVKKGAKISAGLAKGQKVHLAIGTSYKAVCSKSTFTGKVVKNPASVGKATLSITSQTLAGCSLPGVSGVKLKSITAINTPWSASITTKNKLTITGAKKSKPVGVKAVISLGSSTLTCVFTAAKTSGATANKHNTVTFKNQSLVLDSGGLVGSVPLIRWHEGNLLRGLRAGARRQREAPPARVRPVAGLSRRPGWASVLRDAAPTRSGRRARMAPAKSLEPGGTFHVTMSGLTPASQQEAGKSPFRTWGWPPGRAGVRAATTASPSLPAACAPQRGTAGRLRRIAEHEGERRARGHGPPGQREQFHAGTGLGLDDRVPPRVEADELSGSSSAHTPCALHAIGFTRSRGFGSVTGLLRAGPTGEAAAGARAAARSARTWGRRSAECARTSAAKTRSALPASAAAPSGRWCTRRVYRR